MNWPIKKLSEVALINPRRPALERDDSVDTSFVPMEAVDEVLGEVTQTLTQPYSKVKKGYTYFEDGDVIFAKITPCMQNGKHAVVSNLSDNFGFGSTEFHVVRPSEDIISEWIHYYLRRKQTLDAAAKTFTGAVGQQRVPASFLENLEIPVPHPDVQRQIAARLKAQLAEVETARQAAQVQLSDARLLRARLITETFDNTNVAPTLLGDVILGIQAGKSFQTSEILAQPYELGVLKVSAVSWSNFQPDQAKSLNDYYEPEDHHRVCKDDFIISRANTKELVGAVVLVDRDFPFRLLSDKTLRLVIDEEKADKEYLLYALRAPLARNHIEHFATGTSDSMRNISQGVITSIPLVLPSKPEQKDIVQKLKTKLIEIDSIEQSSKAALADIEKLPARILAKAFEN